MLRRPSIRSTVTTLAAAAVLVGGADLASYAATGNAFILGHANAAGGTTALKNTGRGPVLSLNGIKSSPPLTVNSSTMVKHLNANMVGGKTVNQLAPATWRYTLGKRNHHLNPNGEHLFTTFLPKGTYRIQISGFLASSASSDTYDCVTADLNRILGMDESGLWAVQEVSSGGLTDGIMNASDVETLTHKTKVVFGCETENATGTMTTVRPVAFTFQQIAVKDKKGKPFALARNGTPHHLLTR
jgi:hypothetical protein